MIRIVKEGEWVYIMHGKEKLLRMTIGQWTRLIAGQEVDVSRDDS